MLHIVTFVLGFWAGGAIMAVMNAKRMSSTREE